LNFYLINERFMFVDLPGYGYAKAPQEVRRKWRPMIETYLTKRRQLAGVVVIVDSRRPQTEADLSLMTFLQSHEIPFVVTITKADKLSRGEMVLCKRSVGARLGAEVPVVMFSSVNGQGKNQLWKEIKKLIE
jgi:GTP-binding protein